MPEDIQPAYVDSYLAHFGVVGMKWGKRGGKSGGSSSEVSSKPAKAPKEPKATTHDIKLARQHQQGRMRKLQEAEGDFLVARTNKGKDKAEKIMREREKEYFTGKDAKTAAKMTKGEKIAATILFTGAATSIGATMLDIARH